MVMHGSYSMSGDFLNFKHQSVRDLAWAVSSPPLVTSFSPHCFWPDVRWYQQVYQESIDWLKQLDSDPVELDELLEKQKDRRLGKYFETLWYYWFSHHPRFEILENNLQIIIDGETLGEIDFIVFDKKTEKTVHWEVAVKFYLGIGDTSRMNHWFGPNLRDRFDRKVDHLSSKQSVIGSDQRVLHWLRQLGLVIDQCGIILKGRLYYPWNNFIEFYQHRQLQMEKLHAISPPHCSSELLYGFWIKQAVLEQIDDKAQRFVPLINRGWLGKTSGPSANEAWTQTEIFEALEKGDVRFPLHLMSYNPFYGVDRFFLVADDWPEEAHDIIAGL